MCVRSTDSDTTNTPGQIFVQLLPPSVSACDSFYPCVHMQICADCFMHELVNKRVTRSDWMSRLKCCVSFFFVSTLLRLLDVCDKSSASLTALFSNTTLV